MREHLQPHSKWPYLIETCISQDIHLIGVRFIGMYLLRCHGCQDHLSAVGSSAPRGAAGANMAGQYSCTSLISRAFPDLWPRGPEISFCHTIDHCRTILYYFTAYCRLFTLLFRPGGLTGSQTLTYGRGSFTGVRLLQAWISYYT
jgi:hypothetical protein